MAGLGSLAFAAGCGSETEKHLFSLVRSTDDLVTGKAAWYASVCRECPAGCGILVKNREGRAIKIEGNPLHPVNQGKLCMRGQAALQGVYHPDRLSAPQVKDGNSRRTVSFEAAAGMLREKVKMAAKSGLDRVRMVTETVGESLYQLLSGGMERWHAGPPLVYEPLTYDALIDANKTVFGHAELAAYRMAEADLLISFGADFLETWLSPVFYARRFKNMHALTGDKKGCFFHISPHQSLTAANADKWICCKPGTEAVVALGLLREMLQNGKGLLETDIRKALETAVASFSSETVCARCDLEQEAYTKLVRALLTSRTPLVLGAGALADAKRGSLVHSAANLLNLILDPELTLIDFDHPHRVGMAAPIEKAMGFFERLNREPPSLLLLNRVNPVGSLPLSAKIAAALERKDIFVVSFSDCMNDTAQSADLVIPLAHSLEAWDEYGARRGIQGILQPVMAPQTRAPGLGDLFLKLAYPEEKPSENFLSYIKARFKAAGVVSNERQWVQAVRQGGLFDRGENGAEGVFTIRPDWKTVLARLSDISGLKDNSDAASQLVFMTAPSIRFFDGRGADKPWLCEVPDPLTKVAWQSPVLMHSHAVAQNGLAHESVVRIQSAFGEMDAIVYETEGVHPQALVMSMGQGHSGVNPAVLLPEKAATEETALSGCRVSVKPTGRSAVLAHTDGSRIQHGRKIALYTEKPRAAAHPEKGGASTHKVGLTMNDFPLTLPLPEGYSPERDFYPPHGHEGYRWSMVVDLDRCIGCGACMAACYAENNLGVVGEARILEGREMSWLRVERYHDMEDPHRIIFLPMMCQHCDNAPCEPVCPVYAPHHSKEGLNNQVYNRCIGTRFCSQNCPYKVRRFNWFDWKWPHPLEKQLNPDVTVRAKGVMEKCSFCIQRIKAAHGVAKNENRGIRDGEVVPACVQTCPTDALVFGNLMDPESRVRRLVADPRAYQVMGYLNTKPAVIYLKKVLAVS